MVERRRRVCWSTLAGLAGCLGFISSATQGTMATTEQVPLPSIRRETGCTRCWTDTQCPPFSGTGPARKWTWWNAEASECGAQSRAEIGQTTGGQRQVCLAMAAVSKGPPACVQSGTQATYPSPGTVREGHSHGWREAGGGQSKYQKLCSNLCLKRICCRERGRWTLVGRNDQILDRGRGWSYRGSTSQSIEFENQRARAANTEYEEAGSCQDPNTYTQIRRLCPPFLWRDLVYICNRGACKRQERSISPCTVSALFRTGCPRAQWWRCGDGRGQTRSRRSTTGGQGVTYSPRTTRLCSPKGTYHRGPTEIGCKVGHKEYSGQRGCAFSAWTKVGSEETCDEAIWSWNGTDGSASRRPPLRIVHWRPYAIQWPTGCACRRRQRGTGRGRPISWFRQPRVILLRKQPVEWVSLAGHNRLGSPKVPESLGTLVLYAPPGQDGPAGASSFKSCLPLLDIDAVAHCTGTRFRDYMSLYRRCYGCHASVFAKFVDMWSVSPLPHRQLLDTACVNVGFPTFRLLLAPNTHIGGSGLRAGDCLLGNRPLLISIIATLCPLIVQRSSGYAPLLGVSPRLSCFHTFAACMPLALGALSGFLSFAYLSHTLVFHVWVDFPFKVVKLSLARETHASVAQGHGPRDFTQCRLDLAIMMDFVRVPILAVCLNLYFLQPLFLYRSPEASCVLCFLVYSDCFQAFCRGTLLPSEEPRFCVAKEHLVAFFWHSR